MSASFEVFTVESPLPLDLILWRRYRRRVPGLLERTLDINQGLAACGAFIPAGTVITVPVDTPAAQTQRPLVRLWG